LQCQNVVVAVGIGIGLRFWFDVTAVINGSFFFFYAKLYPIMKTRNLVVSDLTNEN